MKRDEGLPGRVWQRHLPLWIADLSDDLMASIGSFSRESDLRGGFAIPLRNGPDVIGVMAFYSQQVRQANDDHLSMLSALGGQIGQFMERKRVEQGLRDSEERYRSVIAALDEGIILIDRDGHVIACNASCERILARKASDIMAVDAAATFASAVDEAESPVPAAELPFVATLHTGEPRQNVVLAVARGQDDQTGLAGKVWISVNSQPLLRFGESVPVRRDGLVQRHLGAQGGRGVVARDHVRAGGAGRKAHQPADGGERAPQERGRRARARPARDARGQGGGRHRQPRQERVPGQHEPRAAHAAERRHRLLRAAGAGDLRRR